jgi:UDP-N-acetylglucosamine:LPS N-acetylglucosamine transferase
MQIMTEKAEAEALNIEDESSLHTGEKRRGLKILFLSSDTGGGHRASAEALATQFQILFPGSTYDLLDIVEKDGVPPYNSLVSYYKHLSSHPTQWKLVYSVSNSRAFEMLADAHLKLMCERAVRKSIKSYNPDVVISVHPLMTNVPVLSCSKISNETHRHLPIFTVVTDLGSAHCLWFAHGVERMFVGSEQVRDLARSRGKVPEEKLELVGLPIRHDFSLQAEKMGDRMSPEGIEYQQKVRSDLGLPFVDRKTVLIMGGGEGNGSMSNTVQALYVELVAQGIDALVLVVCGRNDKLVQSLAETNWRNVMLRWQAAKERNGLTAHVVTVDDICGAHGLPSPGCMEPGTVTGSIRRMLSNGALIGSAISMPVPYGDTEEKKLQDAEIAEAAAMLEGSTFGSVNSIVESTAGSTLGNVKVVGLGFVTRMAEYMVASDILVSKAGPGTISEAAALSLPIMLTSYLPGQEEGNVDYVVNGGFGAFCSDSDPIALAEEVCMWLTDDEKRTKLSRAAKAMGAPYAARDIAKAIGDSTMKWIELNDERATAPKSS